MVAPVHYHTNTPLASGAQASSGGLPGFNSAVSGQVTQADGAATSQFKGANSKHIDGYPRPPRSHTKRNLLIALAVLAVLGLALGLGLGLGLKKKAQDPESQSISSGNFLFDPKKNSMIVGCSPDWSEMSAAQYDRNVGHATSMYDSFFHLSDRLYKEGCRFNTLVDYETSEPGDCFDFLYSQVKDTGAIMSITLMPDVKGYGLDEINAADSTIAATFAARLKRIVDADPNVKIMVRFGHEMNGNWYTYAGYPAEYVAAYRKVADAVRAVARDNVAFIWSPNANMDYPWGNGGSDSRNLQPGSTNTSDPRFQLLDTNGDGIYNNQDDFASPYYPGDEYADWVGLSVYFYNFTDDTQNAIVEPNFVYNAITVGSATDAAKFPNRTNFIEKYSVQKNKPFMISETSAPSLNTSVSGITGLQAKSGMWEQVWNVTLMKDFPTYHGATWFEYQKPEGMPITMRDFRLTADPATRSAFADFLNSISRYVAWAQN
ncbi:hypothetical protein CXG81DRAFT_28355 [Caulochytrium protostelioides]|uniref:Glycoside hydrolase n=1 Tax=Caulochytrium protostelioides TaxID=1555241 RepID=A0A4P9X002_9FUNG|nr:glycoside hydrolase [Caulochytrium protostelioides]RKO98854.1 hypothetical protein CXG81DRAFT_28355 [Caulochytrium protostelioides]|eukprot:RKO98854.1 hypothetical protein CXG81DRAFT_28355 [Caulochytrium protostelioides]